MPPLKEMFLFPLPMREFYLVVKGSFSSCKRREKGPFSLGGGGVPLAPRRGSGGLFYLLARKKGAPSSPFFPRGGVLLSSFLSGGDLLLSPS